MIGTNGFSELFLCILCFIVSGSEPAVLISFPFPASHTCVVSEGPGGWKDRSYASGSPVVWKAGARLWSPRPTGLLPAARGPQPSALTLGVAAACSLECHAEPRALGVPCPTQSFGQES